RLPYSTIIKPIDPSSIKVPDENHGEDIKVPNEINLGDGWDIFTKSCTFLFKKPIFIIPMLWSWLVLVTGIVCFRYFLPFPDSFFLGLLYIYLLILFMSLTICFANLMMLEFMQQIEAGKKISFIKGFKEAAGIDLIRVFPVALVWSILWFIIVVLRLVTSRKKSKNKSEPSAKDIANIIADPEWGPFSWLGLGLDMVEKLLRMVVFLALPAIAWENQGPLSASGKAFDIITKHTVQFLTNYSLTLAASAVMAIPLAIIFVLAKQGVEFSEAFWTGVILYEGVVWTLGIYLEQMSTAILYLWHLKWVKNGASGKLSSISKPDLFDDIYELK
ncbi:MAG TPA: hypothetical protein VF318_00980, partial [Dehalococcoidales bacterium]